MNKTLIAYFSASGETARLARIIANVTGGELFEIQHETAYTAADLDWHDRSSRSTIEMKDEKSRPAIASRVADMKEYDTVFVGYPIWWYSCPMAVKSFLEEYDFSGKTVVPFVAHGTGGISGSVRDMRECLPKDCTVLDPIGVYRPNIHSCQPQIEEWLTKLGF